MQLVSRKTLKEWPICKSINAPSYFLYSSCFCVDFHHDCKVAYMYRLQLNVAVTDYSQDAVDAIEEEDDEEEEEKVRYQMLITTLLM